MWLLSGPLPHTTSKEGEYERDIYLLHHSYDGIISLIKSNYRFYRQKGKQHILSGNPLSELGTIKSQWWKENIQISIIAKRRTEVPSG